MVKFYCDRCGEQMTEKPKMFADGKFAVEPIWYKGEYSYSGHLCTACIKDIVQNGRVVTKPMR